MPDIPKMAKNVTSACDEVDFTNLPKTPTKPEKEVAATEISQRCTEMAISQKVMGGIYTAVSSHSVSKVRQINMAGNI